MTPSELYAERILEMVESPMELTKGMDAALWESFTSIEEVAEGIGLRTAEAQSKSLSPREAYAQSVATYAAVRAIANNIARAKLRLFTPDGREVRDGPLYELLRRPAPGMTTRRWLYEIASWYNISGEWNCEVSMRRGEATPSALLPLFPHRLHIEKPDNPKSRGAVVQWRYCYLDGSEALIRGDHIISDTLFNPGDSVRGLAPTMVGQLVIGSGHAIDRYNKSFFDNSGIPAHLVILGEGTSRQDRKDFERRYMSEYSAARNNAFRAMVVSGGKDVRVENVEQPFQDGAFMDLKRSVAADIAMLYHVPAIEMGIYDKSRFDTAAEERKLFVESTLSPQMEAISEALQTQLVDRFYQFQPRYSKVLPQKAVFTKAMSERFEQARTEREGSDLIVLLDPDTLPIMAAVKAHAISTAKDFRDTLHMSPKEVADYFDFDIEDRPERDDIWVLNNYVNISKPEFNAKINPKTQPGANPPAAPPKPNGRPPETKAISADDRRMVKIAERVSRRLRKLTLQAMDEGGTWSLEEADAIAKGMGLLTPPIRRMIRLVRNDLRKSLDAASDPRAEAKRYFNHQPIKSQLGI